MQSAPTARLCLAFALFFPALAAGSPGDGQIAGRMPQPPSSFGAATSAGFVYALGGHLGRAHDYAREFQSPLLLRASLDSLSDWEVLSAAELGVQGAALVAGPEGLVRIGGMRARNSAGEPMDLVSVDEVAVFNPRSAAWSALPRLPRARSSHAAALCGSRLYVAGGWELDAGDLDHGGSFAGDLLALDLDSTKSGWRSLPGAGFRRGLALAGVRGRLVAIGGMDERGKPDSRVDVFDPASSTWTPGPSFPDFGFGIAACTIGERVYASGRSGRVWRWSLGAPAWEAVGSLLYPRIFHQLVADAQSNALIALGGGLDGQHTAAVERIELTPADTLPRISRLQLPAPLAAKNRQALLLDGDRLEFFGGNNGMEQHGFEPQRFCAEAWSLGLADFTWTRLPDLSLGRQSMGVASLGGERALLVGGFGPGEAKARSHADVFVGASDRRAWNAVAALPQPRTQFGLHEHAGRLWLIGGVDYDASRGAAESFVYPLELLCATVETAPRFVDSGLRLPRPRRAFGSAVLNGSCYLVGGLAGGFARVDVCDVLDLETRSWTTIPPPRSTRVSPELVELEGRLYLAGGQSADADGDLQPDRSIEVFDPATQAWSVCVEELPLDPTHARLFAWHGRLLLVSTHVADADVLELLWIDPVDPQPTR